MTDPDLDDLQNPDEETEAKYGWDVEFQRHIIALLMVDQQFLVQSIDLIKSSYFTNKAHQVVCRILFDLFRRYKMLPRRSILLQELKDDLKEDKAKLAHLGEVTGLYDYFEPGLEARSYLSDKILFFAKIQAAKEAAGKMFKILEKQPEGDEAWGKITEIWRKALNTDRNYEIGLKYFETLQERYERMNAEESTAEIFTTSFKSVDESIKGGGYRRAEMIIFIASSGQGKSLALTGLAADNAKQGKKVVYISLELSVDRVAERFDSILTGENIQTLYDNKENVFSSLEALVEDFQDRNLIVIKHFPGRSADINTIRAYLQQLRFYGFAPDVCIVDYLGEMKYDKSMPQHEAMETASAELRGLADEEQIFMATAAQPNRGAREAQKVGRIQEDQIALAMGIIRPADGVLTLNRNDSEKSINIGRLGVLKQRFGKSDFQVYLDFDPVSLRISEISHTSYKKRMAARVEKVSDDVLVDHVIKEYPEGE